MSKSFRKDLTGQRFGRLTVIEFVPKEHEKSYWKCQCDCGNITIVRAGSLKSGLTHSCGCYGNEQRTTHGLSSMRLYSIWQNMKQRCYNPKAQFYHVYGGRGVTIYDEWKNDFVAFYNWAVANGYSDELTIDRIDVNGNYTPDNCRWADTETQSFNRRNNIIIEYQGRKMKFNEVIKLSGLKPNTLWSRYHVGDRGDKLLRPVTKSKQK